MEVVDAVAKKQITHIFPSRGSLLLLPRYINKCLTIQSYNYDAWHPHPATFTSQMGIDAFLCASLVINEF